MARATGGDTKTPPPRANSPKMRAQVPAVTVAPGTGNAVARNEGTVMFDATRGKPRPFEVEEREPRAVPDEVVQVGVAVDDCARGRIREGIEMSEPLELLAELHDELLVDVLEVRRGLDESSRTVDGERVQVCPD